jgi:hypothetical protein
MERRDQLVEYAAGRTTTSNRDYYLGTTDSTTAWGHNGRATSW